MTNVIEVIADGKITLNNVTDDGKIVQNENNTNDIVTIIPTTATTIADEPPSKSFTIKQKVALIMLALAEFMSFCSMSIMAPFYTKENSDKGLSDTTAGFVFSFYALVVFLSSPVFGKILPKFGARSLFITGLLSSGICNIIFGTLEYIENGILFSVLSFLLRGAEALGASAYSTAGYVLVINIFPHSAGAVRGILETFVGLGLSAGPAVGGLLYAIGGFGLPFYVLGIIIVLVSPLNIWFLPNSKKLNFDTKSGSFKSLMKIPSVIVTCCVITVVSITWSFLDPTVEPHLRKYNLSVGNVGLIFLLLSATYGIFSPAWGWLSDRIRNPWCLMCCGPLCNGICLLFLGPSPLLSFLEENLLYDIVSLAFLGVFVAMGLMPTYQGILDSALEGGFVENLGTHSLVAGLWSCVYSLGEVLGPAIGGVFVHSWGFPVAVTILAGLNFFTSICGFVYFFRKKLREENEITNVDKCNVDDDNVLCNNTNNDKTNNIIFTIERSVDIK